MVWNCKFCFFSCERKSAILRHYRLMHANYCRLSSLPCLHRACLYSFRTFGDLKKHLLDCHDLNGNVKLRRIISFIVCSHCNFKHSNAKEYMKHLRKHLQQHVTVECPYKSCSCKSNISSTFRSHEARVHTVMGLNEFKEDLLNKASGSSAGMDEISEEQVYDANDNNMQEQH